VILDSFNPRKEYALLSEHPFNALHPCGVSWSPDSTMLAVGGTDGHVWVYDCRECAEGGLPDLSKVGDGESHPWNPSLPKPTCVILGQSWKSKEAAEAAFVGAKDYHRRKLSADVKLFESKSGKKIEELAGVRPGGVVWKTAGECLPPLAAKAEEMISRMEGPVTALAWHPTSFNLAAASRGHLSFWGIIDGENLGGALEVPST